jgi:hypothetical protein
MNVGGQEGEVRRVCATENKLWNNREVGGKVKPISPMSSYTRQRFSLYQV